MRAESLIVKPSTKGRGHCDLLAEREWQYWDGLHDDPLNTGILEDSVRPVFAAGLVDLIDWDHEVCEGVRLRPTPGHNRGHVSVHIDGGHWLDVEPANR